jgi:hypothetical protein
MSQLSHTQLNKLVIDQVKESTPKTVISVIVDNMSMSAKAKKRIEDEGIVVRDVKGSIVSHPAIKIEADCNKIICELIDKYKRGVQKV